MIDDNNGLATITLEDYNYLLKRDRQLEFALDMVPNLDDLFSDENVIEQLEEE